MRSRTPSRPARRLTRLAGATARRAAWRTALAASGGLTRSGRLPVGGCVVVANHCSHADTPALLAGLDAAHTPRVAAAADYWFTTPLRATFCRGAVAGFPVRRTGGGFADLCAAGETLRCGGAVVVFPSGSRTATGVCHAGAFRLAARHGVPVVPVGLAGTAQVLPKSGTPARHRVSVRIGEPIPVPDDNVIELDRAVRLAVDALGLLAQPAPASGAQSRRRRRRAGRGSAPRDDSAKPPASAEIAASR